MNLFASILTSIIIVIAVWFGAMYQPTSAYAEMIIPSTTTETIKNTVEVVTKNDSPLITLKVASNKTEKAIKQRPDNTPVNFIAGVKRHMAINNIDQLWNDFESNEVLHAKLESYPTAIYVLYRNFSKNFKNADIIIGYNNRELNVQHDTVALPKGRYQTVTNGSKLSSKQLAKAWDKLDFSQDVVIVEKHQLNRNADVINISMQVLYK